MVKMNIKNKYMKRILKEMCKRVGVKYDNIDFAKSNWFLKYEWTQKEQDEFCNWLTNYLQKNEKARDSIMRIPAKKLSEDASRYFIYQYGWKLKPLQHGQNID